MDLETASQRMISPKPRSHVKRDGFEGTHAGNMRSMSPKCRYILPKAENTPVGLKTEWRRGWDLNQRYSFPYTALPMPRLRPLGHLSTAVVVRPLRSKVAVIQYLQYVSPTIDVDRNLFRRRVKLCMAERVGFEPTVQLPGQRFSRPPDSAALAPLLRTAHVISSFCRSPLRNSCSNARHSSSSTPPTTSMRWFKRRSSGMLRTEPQAPPLGSLTPKTTRSTRARTAAPMHIAHGSIVTYRVPPTSRQVRSCADASRIAISSAWAVGSCQTSRRLCARAATVPATTSTAPIGTSPAAAARRASSNACRM